MSEIERISLGKLLNDLSLHHPIRSIRKQQLGWAIMLYEGLLSSVALEMDRSIVSDARKGDGRKPQLDGDTVVFALQHEAILVTTTTGRMWYALNGQGPHAGLQLDALRRNAGDSRPKIRDAVSRMRQAEGDALQ